MKPVNCTAGSQGRGGYGFVPQIRPETTNFIAGKVFHPRQLPLNCFLNPRTPAHKGCTGDFLRRSWPWEAGSVEVRSGRRCPSSKISLLITQRMIMRAIQSSSVLPPPNLSDCRRSMCCCRTPWGGRGGRAGQVNRRVRPAEGPQEAPFIDSTGIQCPALVVPRSQGLRRAGDL